MKRLFLTIMLFPLTAMATNNGGNHGSNNGATSSLNATQVTNVGVHANVHAGATSSANSTAFGGTATAQGGTATNGGNSVSINSQDQWPSSFATGFSQASNNGCRAGFGVNGGYGGVVLPFDDEDCELQGAAQLAYATGDINSYCALMAKTEAYEIAEITFRDCITNHNPKVLEQKIIDDFTRDFPTPASDRLKKLYPTIGQ